MARAQGRDGNRVQDSVAGAGLAPLRAVGAAEAWETILPPSRSQVSAAELGTVTALGTSWAESCHLMMTVGAL